MINKTKIYMTLFILMIFTASIPYLGYGIVLIRNGYVLIGTYSNSMENIVAYSGLFGKIFAYFKDLLCVLLITTMMFMYKKGIVPKIYIYVFLFLTYGLILLIFNDYIYVGYLMAGIRTFMYAIASVIFFNKILVWDSNLGFLNKLKKTMDLTLLIQLIVVFLQIQMSRNWSRFGSGAYRFCGAFPGYGNLGCYTIALAFFYLILDRKYNLMPNFYMAVIRTLGLLFLSVASGTRTTMILMALALVYQMISHLLKTIGFNFKSILASFIIIAMAFGIPIISAFVEWTDRGHLLKSGSGRIYYFWERFSSASLFELIFGRGIGVGTNAAIILGMDDVVSDSTINLIFVQFGLLGLCIFLFALYRMMKKMLYKMSEDRGISIIFILTIATMLIVGNLFEHVAMCILLLIDYYCMIYDGNKIECSKTRS